MSFVVFFVRLPASPDFFLSAAVHVLNSCWSAWLHRVMVVLSRGRHVSLSLSVIQETDRLFLLAFPSVEVQAPLRRLWLLMFGDS